MPSEATSLNSEDTFYEPQYALWPQWEDEQRPSGRCGLWPRVQKYRVPDHLLQALPAANCQTFSTPLMYVCSCVHVHMYVCVHICLEAEKAFGVSVIPQVPPTSTFPFLWGRVSHWPVSSSQCWHYTPFFSFYMDSDAQTYVSVLVKQALYLNRAISPALLSIFD